MSRPSASSPLIPRAVNVFPGPGLLWRTGALLAAAGMIAGAFGSHGLQKRPGITPEKLHAWQTASSYAIYNGLALLLVSMNPRFAVHRFAGPAIAAGSLLFSGSIVALVLARDRLKWLGPVTPIGGSIMIAGYIALAF
ncbi:hypothetical protein BD414DRAFT_579554 [Trametes punicea]|nr:hypothetical protein BD414DRAFT_579554 [Trametes punicea]